VPARRSCCPMSTESTPHQVEHIYCAGLRFDGAPCFAIRGLGPTKDSKGFCLVTHSKDNKDGGLGWCERLATSLLARRPASRRDWRALAVEIQRDRAVLDAEAMATIIQHGGVGIIQLRTEVNKWWSVISGIELNRATGLVTHLLLLDSSQPLAWGSGFNARLPVTADENAKYRWLSVEAGTRSVIVAAWSSMMIPAS